MPFVREMPQTPPTHQRRPVMTPPPPPPVKPRGPQIQQQSYDDSGKPSIRLYDPASVVVHHPSLPALPPRSPTYRSGGAQQQQHQHAVDSPLAIQLPQPQPMHAMNAISSRYDNQIHIIYI